MTTSPSNCHSEVPRGIPIPSLLNCHSEAWAEVLRSIPTPSSTKSQSPQKRIPTFLLNTLLFLITLIILPHPALAHSQPLKLEPTPGARLNQSPPEIRLTFSEPIHPDATISLFPQENFIPITGIMAQQDPGNPAQIFAPLPRLAPGTYTVQWQIQSSDGHTLTGTYAFNIRPALWPTLLPWLSIPIILLAVTLIIHRYRQKP
jgi:methionine-rich copper-binding protein CopC